MKYALLMMLLVGLLVPMTIASSSIDFDLNTVLFDDQEIAITVDVLKSVHPIKTKFMITKEGAEGIRKRSYIGSKVDMFNYISAYPPSENLLSQLAKKEEQSYSRKVRYHVDIVVNHIQKQDNYIRYL